MHPSKFKIRKIEDLKKKALVLYKQGLSTREVAKIINRSHNWVAMAVRELSPQ
jgi:transposase